MMQQVQAVIPTARGFLNSQGANQWFVDQAKNAINRNFGAGSVQKYFGWQGISYYPTDNLTAYPGSTQGLYNAVMADINRQHGYLAADVADAHASGLKEFIYEASVDGMLTQSGITAAQMDAWLADPLSGAATTAMLNDIQSQLTQSGEGMMWFTLGSDYWGGQLDIMGPQSQVTKALFAKADAMAVTAPEPNLAAGLLVVWLAVLLLRRSRRLGA
jgi:hypothetical protein